MGDGVNKASQSRRTASVAGKKLGGYEIIEQIGRGAMGTVFKARQLSVDRIVALKVLPPRLTKDPAFVDRFLRESRAAAKLNHPNVVQAIDAGQAGGYYFFAMEYVDGPGIDKVLARSGRLPEQRALEIIRDISHALNYAHTNAQLIHRDIKPSNILLTQDGMAKLADLGLAREMADADSSLTKAGVAMGTPNYISPEQVRGDRDLDGRADIYALAATLFHLVTGKPPYEGGTATEVMASHLHKPIPSARQINPKVSTGTAELIRRGMAKQRERRYPTMRAFLDAVETILAQQAAQATGTSSAEATQASDARRRAPAAGRKPIYIGLAAGVALLAAVLLLVYAGFGGAPPSNGPEPLDPQIAHRQAADREQLDVVQSWVQENPGNYAEGIKRFDAALAAMSDGATRTATVQARDSLRETWVAAADAEFSRLEQQAATLREAGDYNGALAVYANLPAAFAALIEERARQASRQLHVEVESRLTQAISAARTWAKAGNPKKALEELDRVAHIRYDRRADELQQLRQTLKAKPTNVAEKRARAKVEALLAAIEASAEKREFSEAARLAKAAEKDEVMALAQNHLNSVVALGKAFAALAKVAEAKPAEILRLRIGEDETLRTASGVYRGTLKEVTQDNAILERVFSIDGQEHRREYRVNLSELTAEELTRLRGTWTPKTPDEHLVAALVAIQSRQMEEAQAALTAAKGHPLHARYAAKLVAISPKTADPVEPKEQDVAKEAEARDTWEKIADYIREHGVNRITAKPISKALDVFDEKYGDTAFASSVQVQVDRLRLRVGPGEAPKLLGNINLVRRIDIERDRLHGVWHIKDGALQVQPVARAGMTLPVVPKGDYELRLEVTRVKGRDSFNVGLPVGDKNVMLVIDGERGTISGIENIEGRRFYQTDIALKRGLLVNDHRYRILVTVRTRDDQVRINVQLDGLPILTWQGEERELSTPGGWPLKHLSAFYVGAQNSGYIFHSVSLKMLTGSAELMYQRR
jgi:hypothetical protein